ncbi:MAG: hypothetical protein WCD89_20140 [Anaerocolumna sp.]
MDSVAVYNEENSEVTIFAVNRNLEDGIEFTCDIRSFNGYELIEHIVLASDDLLAANSAIKQAVGPVIIKNGRVPLLYSFHKNVFSFIKYCDTIKTEKIVQNRKCVINKIEQSNVKNR